MREGERHPRKRRTGAAGGWVVGGHCRGTRVESSRGLVILFSLLGSIQVAEVVWMLGWNTSYESKLMKSNICSKDSYKKSTSPES